MIPNQDYSQEKLRWGILGTGRIAQTFASDLQWVEGSEIQAVGSRSLGKAQAFAQSFEAQRSYGSYEELAQDPDVDVIYVATPHTRHCQDTLLCLNSGKHVLCEKPFAMNLTEVERMIDSAQKKQLFLMEAMWTRFNPNIVEIIQLVYSGRFGVVQKLECQFGFQFPYDPKHRVFNPALGGGSLLDLGVYNVALAYFVFGETPEEIDVDCQIGKTGVDEEMRVVLRYSNKRVAILRSSLRETLDQTATVFGELGKISIPNFWRCEGYRHNLKWHSAPLIGKGYAHEAIEVEHCIRLGKKESSTMSLDATLAISETLDEILSLADIDYSQLISQQ